MPGAFVLTQEEIAAKAAAHQQRHAQWQGTIRKDMDYNNLSPADYAAMEADLQARPRPCTEHISTTRFHRSVGKLVVACFLLLVILVGKLFGVFS